MDDGFLNRLERKVDALLQSYERLKRDNTKLRHKQSELLARVSKLEKKREFVIGSINKLIGKLKLIERKNSGRE